MSENSKEGFGDSCANSQNFDSILREMPIPALLSLMKKNYNEYMEKNLEEDDIQIGQIPILFVLKKHDKISQKELAEHLHYSEGLITRFIKKLEENMYIKRNVNPENKRENIISINPKGEKLVDEISEYKDKWEMEVFDFLSQDEFFEFKEKLEIAIINSKTMLNK
ncbi:MarR family transcriptional regulator [uncultured Methanobrevibacter sp.]|uniref:MarR family winged helix-turn-helix transcriptional regulator n=1 Tax=uncultured Methanobrevibacter sp. TaxID=253161 RepID=UPI00260245B3